MSWELALPSSVKFLIGLAISGENETKDAYESKRKCGAPGFLFMRCLSFLSQGFPSLPPLLQEPAKGQEVIWAGELQGCRFPSLDPGWAGTGRSPGALMTLSRETEAERLRSICHYGNKVARPFFL